MICLLIYQLRQLEFSLAIFLNFYIEILKKYGCVNKAVFLGPRKKDCHSMTTLKKPFVQFDKTQLWCYVITKTCLYNFDPFKPHFYTVKLGFTGVYIIFLNSAQNIDCGYSLEPPRWGGSNEYPQSIFWAEIWKILEIFIRKCSIFGSEIFYIFV